MNNKTKKILAGVGLGLVGMGCLTGCNAEEIKIPTDYNVTTPTDYNVTVNQEKQYRLTVINDSDNGTIYPNLSNETCSVMVEEGDDYTFTIRAKEGYKLDNLLIDGELVEPQEIYTFENVDADHSIGAVYSEIIDKRNYITKLKLIGIEVAYWGKEGSSFIGSEHNANHGFDLCQNKTIKDKDYLFDDDVVELCHIDEWKHIITTEEGKSFTQIAVNASNDIIVPSSGKIVLTIDKALQREFSVDELSLIENDYYSGVYEYAMHFTSGGGEADDPSGWLESDFKFIFVAEYSF